MARPSDHPYGERILRLEDPVIEGLDVWELQIKLIGWGSGTDNDGIGYTMDPVRVNGKFDATTRDAAMRFQKAHDHAVTGIVDAALFHTIDKEAIHHPVPLHDLKCPCTLGNNDEAIQCRCNDHPEKGKCTGFGKQRFVGKFLLDGKKLADDTDISAEKLDVYDVEEYDGMDKALLWAVRALLHRTGLQTKDTFKPLQVVSGYRCWEDNYHHTDTTRWHHRRSTFHFGKTIEFYIRDHCTDTKWDDTKASCSKCDTIRKTAVEKCGFQLRWQESDRISVAEGSKQARPPAAPFSVHIDTVRRLNREKDEFVKSDLDGCKPLFSGKINHINFPLELEQDDGLDLQSVPSQKFFTNVESGAGGWFPLSASRTWHGGIHLNVDAGHKIQSIADGEIIGCRVGEAEDKHPHGSRNFVLLKHTLKQKGNWKDKVFYSLYMHLDAGKPSEEDKIPWRRQLFLKSKAHVEALAPCPLFKLVKEKVGQKGKFIPCEGGLATGERIEVTGGEIDAKDLSIGYPTGHYKVVKLEGIDDSYIFTRRDNVEIAKLKEADATLAEKFNSGDVISLNKPIQITAGDALGKVAATPTDDSLKERGSYLHLETFAKEALPVNADFITVNAEDKAKIADRKEAIAALIKAKLLPSLPNDVILEKELKDIVSNGPYNTHLRSVALTCQNGWAVDWKKALKDAKCYGFMKDTDRDALGDAFNEYSWWKEVAKVDGALPDSDVVYHYHPIALLLQIAHS